MNTALWLMDKEVKTSTYFYTPALVWGILILYFSLMPGNEVPTVLIELQDTVIHFCIYTVLGILFLLAKSGFRAIPVSDVYQWVTFISCSFFGLAIELLQENFVSGRTFEWSDVFANAAGCLMVWVVNFYLKKKKSLQSNY